MEWNIHHRGLIPYNYNTPSKQLNEDTQVRDSRIDEYLQGYFGDSLTEDVSGDDIIEAFADLLETARAVEEYCINEGLMDRVKSAGRAAGRAIASGAKKVGKALVSDKAKKIYKKTGSVAADTVGAAGRGVADVAKTAYSSARKQTGI